MHTFNLLIWAQSSGFFVIRYSILYIINFCDGLKHYVYFQIKEIPNHLAVYLPQAIRCSLHCSLEMQSNVVEEFKKYEKKYYLAFIHDVWENWY